MNEFETPAELWYVAFVSVVVAKIIDLWVLNLFLLGVPFHREAVAKKWYCL